MTDRASLPPMFNQPVQSGPITIDAGLLQALWCYGFLHPITGIVYHYGTHQKALDDAEKALLARDAAKGALLPCDVHLPPNTFIRKGCQVETLLQAIKGREKYSDADNEFDPTNYFCAAPPLNAERVALLNKIRGIWPWYLSEEERSKVVDALASPPKPAPDAMREALAYASTNQIAVCRCGSFPSLYDDGARPDDGYRSLWCQTCMEHVTEMKPSEREVIDYWNDLREREHAALSTPVPPADGAQHEALYALDLAHSLLPNGPNRDRILLASISLKRALSRQAPHSSSEGGR